MRRCPFMCVHVQVVGQVDSVLQERALRLVFVGAAPDSFFVALEAQIGVCVCVRVCACVSVCLSVCLSACLSWRAPRPMPSSLRLRRK